VIERVPSPVEPPAAMPWLPEQSANPPACNLLEIDLAIFPERRGHRRYDAVGRAFIGEPRVSIPGYRGLIRFSGNLPPDCG